MGFGSFVKHVTGISVAKKVTNKVFGSNKAEEQAKKQQAEYEAQVKKDEMQAEQEANRNRQNESNLEALAEQGDSAGGGENGILTSPVGLVDTRKLNKKKTLGG